MYKKPISNTRGIVRIVKHAIAIAALGACGLAHAGLLNFEEPSNKAVIKAGDVMHYGDFWVYATANYAQAGDQAGWMIKGTDPAACSGGFLSCPINNPSTYYAGLNDGIMVFGREDGGDFSLAGFSASFIGAGQTYADTAGALLFEAYDAANNLLGGTYAFLSGPTGGAFRFANYTTGTFSEIIANHITVYGLSCDQDGICSNEFTLGNFAIDNLQTVEALAAVPEPASLALFGLGLAGIGAVLRRRAA